MTVRGGKSSLVFPFSENWRKDIINLNRKRKVEVQWRAQDDEEADEEADEEEDERAEEVEGSGEAESS